MKTVCFGELLLRLAAPNYTKLFQKDCLDATFCGSEANVAVSLQNYGINATFVSKLPDDDIGHAAAKSLSYFEVDTKHIIYENGRMGLFYLEKGVSQRPSKIIYDRKGSTFSLAVTRDFDWDDLFFEADWFHWSGITPALSNELGKVCLEACRVAQKKGIRVSCDLNYRSKLWTALEAQKTMEPLMSYVDVCICNEEDAKNTLGINNKNSDVEHGKITNEDYIDTAREICKKYGCEYVAITLRKSYSASRNKWYGMLYNGCSQMAFFSREYDIHIIDRVGSGDSFSAGIIFSMLKEYEDQKTIDFATAASCLKHTISGDFNRVTKEDVELLLCTGGSGRIQR